MLPGGRVSFRTWNNRFRSCRVRAIGMTRNPDVVVIVARQIGWDRVHFVSFFDTRTMDRVGGFQMAFTLKDAIVKLRELVEIGNDLKRVA
jgi:hypothetical protein